MRSSNERNGPLEDTAYREMRLLSEVQSTPDTSQRSLSRRLGIALGMTNLLLRRLAQKGYVRITHARWRGWVYALTPAGFSRKVQLTVSYIQRFLDHYQAVRQTFREELEPLGLNAESRVLLYGAGEFAELVYLGLKELEIERVDIVAPTGTRPSRFLGMPVREAETVQPEDYDWVVVAFLNEAGAGYSELQTLGIAPEKVVTLFAHAGAQRSPEVKERI